MTARGYDREERQTAVDMARMEIQGALESLIPISNEFQQLNGATTGILERPTRLQCEYCQHPSGHRNGDCMLPWRS